MEVFTILKKNMKWRYHNSFTIIITILQPILWLALYSTVAKQSMQGAGIQNYTAYILPGLVVLVSFSACSSSGIMNYIMKTEGSFYRILIAPIKRSTIVFGQVLEAILCTFFEVSIMFVISLLFSVNVFNGVANSLIIILLVFLTAFFMASVAYGISLILPNEMIYETIMNAIVLPIFFLSSALFPIDRINGFLKVIINLNPFTHVINSIRAIMFDEVFNVTEVYTSILLLFILSLISFYFANKQLKKEMDL
ncbi:inner membrane transport permease [Streptococcus pneumoniae]|uniref:Transport permease protein n=1 Tax=Streptococcus pneumoniae TaxID=1313 RepID=A0AAJ5TIM3_STREE|nr:ABC transporter permease [Streptococcus pneumoniae]CEO64875.1 inner membrane transport permease [Streptococcus pneumoniae]CEW84432.1 inner membrane transport permease [Streptococcus pneumoniae]CEX63566.1 inner membrane transport permease [Streptococcus pneumoniae]CIT25902.1 inner membrane transport permease [Streptococcus pneumoniae]CJF18132.1 inner membrane transport permease [Streptococcus pneumoniae]